MYEEDGRLSEGRDGKPIPRLNLPTPCSLCPRKSPEREKETTATRRHWAAYEVHLKTRATFGRYLDGKVVDEPASMALAACELVMNEIDHERQMELALLGRPST